MGTVGALETTALNAVDIPWFAHKTAAPWGPSQQKLNERDQKKMTKKYDTCGEIKLAAFTPLKKDQGELGEATIETPTRVMNYKDKAADDAGPETYR